MHCCLRCLGIADAGQGGGHGGGRLGQNVLAAKDTGVQKGGFSGLHGTHDTDAQLAGILLGALDLSFQRCGDGLKIKELALVEQLLMFAQGLFYLPGLLEIRICFC